MGDGACTAGDGAGGPAQGCSVHPLRVLGSSLRAKKEAEPEIADAWMQDAGSGTDA